MRVDARAWKSVDRCLYVSVYLLALALGVTCIVRLWPSWLGMLNMSLIWLAAWMNVNATLALAERLRLMEAVRDGDVARLVRIDRVELWRHALARMTFRDPSGLYP